VILAIRKPMYCDSTKPERIAGNNKEIKLCALDEGVASLIGWNLFVFAGGEIY
jgi:hypothetical protein